MKYSDLQEKGQQLTQNDIKTISNRIKSDLKIARDNINTRLKKLYAVNLSELKPDDYYNYMIQRNRLESLLQYSTDQYNAVGLSRQQANASKVALSNEFYRQQFVTDQMARQLGVSYPFTIVPDGLKKASIWGEFVKGYEEFIPKYGGTLKATLNKNRIADLQRLRQTLVSGFLSGDSYTKMSNGVKDMFNWSYSNAMRVIRTEGHRNMESASYENSQNAKEAGIPIVRKILATLDTRTRSQSASMDGKAEDKDGYFTYPNGAKARFPGNTGVARYDINDRETVIDTINGEDPQLRRVDGELVSFTKFDDWADEKGLKKNAYGELYIK